MNIFNRAAKLALTLSAFASTVVCQIQSGPATLVVPEIFEDLGYSVGAAEQKGFGSLYPGTTMALRLSGATPGAPVQCIIGYTKANASLGSGVLVPAADIIIPMIADANGNADVQRLVAANLPFGSSFFAQWITRDYAQPSNIGLSNAFECHLPSNPVNGSLLYDDVMASINSAAGAFVDQTLINQIIADEAVLRTDPPQLLDLITVISTDTVIGLTSGSGPQQNGGNVDGPDTTYRNIFGGRVGSGRVNVTWATSNGRRKITGHTAVGGILLGSVDSKQIGAKWWHECPDGTLVQRANYQSSSSQGFRWVLKQTIKDPVYVIGPPCPPAA